MAPFPAPTSSLAHVTPLSILVGFWQKEIVETNLESLRSTIDLKRKNLEMIVSVMRRKIADIETKRAEFRGGEDGSAVETT